MIGRVLSHYRILEKLGAGGMGVVYKAEDTKLSRIVALKCLPPGLGVTESDRLRFLQEAKAAAMLNHPNVATIYEIDEAAEQVFIAMEYVEGETLKSTIAAHRAKGTRVPIAQVIELGSNIADALAAAHRAGVTHRDIKSDNIIIGKDGRPKILDFGLAKLNGGVALTKAGKTVGTLAYMSPEQILGEEVDSRTDLWSFGVVLYEMLTGELPFRAEHEAAVMYEVLNAEPAPPEKYRADTPEHVRTILSKLLEKDRSRRLASAKAVVDGLLTAPPAPSPSAPAKSIAVLYFENMSSETENEYFCAGITEDILTDLSRIKDLSVVSRTDVLPFRDKEVNIRQVGDALRVNYILEGSVRKSGNKMRITAQLIEVSNGYHLWAERFDRLVEDIFDVQNEVSQRIVEALKISLTDSEKESLTKKPTDDLRAYDFYMRGREYINKRGRKNNEAAIQMFMNAIALDARFASPYAGLAESYAYMYEWYDGNTEWLGKAIEMNQKALSLDPTSLEAQFGIAMLFFYQQRLPEARRTLEPIIRENPEFCPPHMLLGMIAEVSGDPATALKHFRRAAELKPQDEESWIHLDVMYRKMGDQRASEDAAMQVIAVTARKLEASLNDVIVMSGLARAYARFGALAEAKATLKRVMELDPSDGLVLYNCSCAYAHLGDKNRAFVSLRKASENGFRAVAIWAKGDTAFDAFRDNPEFTRLMAELM
jgi:serine/threonine protein kinase/cytochrome c-type biogenesis protein CcmH/NrfG